MEWPFMRAQRCKLGSVRVFWVLGGVPAHRHWTASLKPLLFKEETSEVVADRTWARTRTAVWSNPPALCCLDVLQQAVPALLVHFFLLQLHRDSFIRQTQKHVIINECLLPERKPVMGLLWAALARCAALNWTAGFCCLDLQLSIPNLLNPQWGEKLMEAVSHPQEERYVQDLGGKLLNQALCI